MVGTAASDVPCSEDLCNDGWLEVLSHMSPYGWANMGIAFGLGFSVIGAAWGIWLTGSSIVGASIKAPRVKTKNLFSIIFCEAIAIYGVILSMILYNKISEPDYGTNDGEFPSDWDWNKFYYAGYAIFSAGLTVGFSNIASGVSVGVAGSSCVLGDAQDRSLFVKILIVEIFASAIGVFGLIVGLIVSTNADFPTE